MKKILNLLICVTIATLMSCGGKDKKEGPSYGRKISVKTENKVPASQRVELSNKGVGAITSVFLSEEIDQEMVLQGKEIYNKMCSACHKIDKKYIGPTPKGILKRRSPEWVMNMILSPDVMVKKDPLAKDLLNEYNGSPMINQGLSEEEARAILEYFRTL